jgi:hypothetical protein
MAFIAEEIDVMFEQDGQVMMTCFTGDDRLERALRYAQGLLDEHKVSIIRERSVTLDGTSPGEADGTPA